MDGNGVAFVLAKLIVSDTHEEGCGVYFANIYILSGVGEQLPIAAALLFKPFVLYRSDAGGHRAGDNSGGVVEANVLGSGDGV